MAWMGGWFDPELEDLFHDEPELLETAQKVRAARPRVEPDPRFQNRLRAQLVAEASRGAGAPEASGAGGVSDRRTSRGAEHSSERR